MPKNREEIKRSPAVTGSWVSPHYGDGGWHGTPGCLTFDPGGIRPMGDHILVKLDPEPEQVAMLFTPDVARHQDLRTRLGTVLRVGPGRWKDKLATSPSWALSRWKRTAMTLKPGDRVIIGPHSDWESWQQSWEAQGPNIVLCQEADVRLIEIAAEKDTGNVSSLPVAGRSGIPDPAARGTSPKHPTKRRQPAAKVSCR